MQGIFSNYQILSGSRIVKGAALEKYIVSEIEDEIKM